MILSQDSVLQTEHIPRELLFRQRTSVNAAEESTHVGSPPPNSTTDAEAEVNRDRHAVLVALHRSVWNVSQAAEKLSISRTHLHRLIKKYKIKRGE
jgi:transcriptional regulator of acetoin/glycerol metabolism